MSTFTKRGLLKQVNKNSGAEVRVGMVFMATKSMIIEYKDSTTNEPTHSFVAPGKKLIVSIDTKSEGVFLSDGVFYSKIANFDYSTALFLANYETLEDALKVNSALLDEVVIDSSMGFIEDGIVPLIMESDLMFVYINFNYSTNNHFRWVEFMERLEGKIDMANSKHIDSSVQVLLRIEYRYLEDVRKSFTDAITMLKLDSELDYSKAYKQMLDAKFEADVDPAQFAAYHSKKSETRIPN